MAKHEKLRAQLRYCYGRYWHKIDRQGRVFAFGRNSSAEIPTWHFLGTVWSLNSKLNGRVLPLPYVVMPLSRRVEGIEKWPYPLGTRVRHAKYGEGTIVGYLHNGSSLQVQVRFPDRELGFIPELAKLQPVA